MIEMHWPLEVLVIYPHEKELLSIFESLGSPVFEGLLQDVTLNRGFPLVEIKDDDKECTVIYSSVGAEGRSKV